MLFSIACEETLDNYVSLEFGDFMDLPNDEIADSIAVILNVAPVVYNQIVSIGMLFHDDLKWTVKEGYEYIANDTAKITVWVDEEDSPYYVTYELERNTSEIRNNNELLQLQREFINAPTRYAPPALTGNFGGGVSPAAGSGGINIYMPEGSSGEDVVGAIERAYGEGRRLIGSRPRRFSST